MIIKKITLTLVTFFTILSCGKVINFDNRDQHKKDFDKGLESLEELSEKIGTLKLGVVGYSLNKPLEGLEINNVIKSWTYNRDSKKHGIKYQYLDGRINLSSSNAFNAGKYASAKNSLEFKMAIRTLKSIFIMLAYYGHIFVPKHLKAQEVFNDELIGKLYVSLKDYELKDLTPLILYKKIKSLSRFFIKDIRKIELTNFPNLINCPKFTSCSKITRNSDLLEEDLNKGTLFFSQDIFSVDKNHPYFEVIKSYAQNIGKSLQKFNTFKSLLSDEKTNEYIKKFLTSKNDGAKKKRLNALFIQVKDGVHNSSDVYQALVSEDVLKDTKIVMLGEKSKHQKGDKSKVFAKKNITTGSYNEYASAFLSGFKTAVLQLDYDKKLEKFKKTQVSFLIGSINEKKYRQRAYAFLKGVEAAIKHKDYAPYLQVRFVSKYENSKLKRLANSISVWKKKKDKKSHLYRFVSSKSFQYGDKKIVYISGATREDWKITHTGAWNRQQDTGLLGAFFNYDEVEKDDTNDKELSPKKAHKTFIVLDKQLEKDYPLLIRSIHTSFLGPNNAFRERGLKVIGYIGGESSGTTLFTNNIVKALFFDKEDRRLEKHTLYGGDLILDLNYVSNDLLIDLDQTIFLDITTNSFNTIPLEEKTLIEKPTWM